MMSFFSLTGQTLPKPRDPYKESLQKWSKFQIKSFSNGIHYSAGVIIDHYIVFLVHDNSLHPSDRSQADDYDSEEDEPATLFAFNILDHSVQQAKINSSLFGYQDGYYRFLKYGDNQIIKYGGRSSEYSPSSFVLITVESFEPFKVRCEEIKDDCKGKFSNCTAQIYKDSLYVYGRTKGIWGREPSRNELWSFDLKNYAWKLCEMTGYIPEFDSQSELDYGPSSFIFQDSFYLYGFKKDRNTTVSDLFMLTFSSMKWTKIPQQEKYLEAIDDKQRERFGGAIYKNHLVTLKEAITSSENALCFLDLNTKNTWKAFDINGTNEDENRYISHAITGDLMVYKNLLLSLTTGKYDGFLNVVMMNIDIFGISMPKSEEDEKLSHLFMNPKGSDVTFKVQDELIPGHKQVLVRRSRYFEGLFKSSMAETRQGVIEIKDCKPGVFREYLQWIYQGRAHIDSVDLAMTLYVLTDKYVQEDLRAQCLSFLIDNLKWRNTYEVLDFANERDVFELKIWCVKFLKDKLSVGEIAGLIEYLGRQEDQEFKERNKELRDLALNFIIDNFWNIQRDSFGNMLIHENFILKNIEMDTLPALARFLSPVHPYVGDAKVVFEQFVGRIKEKVFGFIQKNIQSVMTEPVRKEFSNDFFAELSLYLAGHFPMGQAGERKRMEPCQSDLGKESHELKKTKKSDFT